MLTFLAPLALETRVAHGSDTDQISQFELGDILAHSDNLSHNLVSDNLGVHLGHIPPSSRCAVMI